MVAFWDFITLIVIVSPKSLFANCFGLVFHNKSFSQVSGVFSCLFMFWSEKLKVSGKFCHEERFCRLD